MSSSDIERLIKLDPIARAFSNWLQSYDYDGWKEIVLWPEDESVNFFAELNALRTALNHEGAGFYVTGDTIDLTTLDSKEDI